MGKFLAWLAISFSPRRSFAYRELETRLARMTIERDDYRDRWVEAVNQALLYARQPRLGAQQSTQDSPPAPQRRLTRGEIEAEFQAKRRADYEAYLTTRPKEGQPNDVDSVQ